MAAQALLLLVPEAIGLGAGMVDWLLGDKLPKGVREALDSLDELSIINSALEGMGVASSAPAESTFWKYARPAISLGSMAIPVGGAFKGAVGATRAAKALAGGGKLAQAAGRIGSGLGGVGSMYAMFHRVESSPQMFGLGGAQSPQQPTMMTAMPTTMPTTIPLPQTLPFAYGDWPQPTGGPIPKPTIPVMWQE